MALLSATSLGDTLLLAISCGFLWWTAKLLTFEHDQYKKRKAAFDGSQPGAQQQARTSKYGSFMDFLSYRLDYFFSSYWWSKMGCLGFLTAALILAGGVVITLIRLMAADSDGSFGGALWDAWTFVADPGTHAETEGTGNKAVAFVLTLGGMLVFALVIGIVADALSDYVDGMKKGRSAVFESSHTLILGWGDKLLPVINQIALANESEGGDVIVILAEQDKEEMEQEILNSKVLQLRGSTLIFRSGSPCILDDLRKVAADQARAVVLLADPSLQPEESDAQSVRSVLALSGLGVQCHIVADVCDADNVEMVQLVGGNIAEALCSHDTIGRVMLQCARQPGLSNVLENLMGFEGCEFYFEEWPELVGQPFSRILFAFDDAVPLGFRRTVPANKKNAHEQEEEKKTETKSLMSGPSSGSLQQQQQQQQLVLMLNPDPDTIYEAGDQICVLAEDNDTYEPRKGDAAPSSLLIDDSAAASFFVAASPSSSSSSSSTRKISLAAWKGNGLEGLPSGLAGLAQATDGGGGAAKREHILFCGWRRDMDDLIMELDKYVARGSTLTLFSAVAIEERGVMLLEGGLSVAQLRNLSLIHRAGSYCLRKDLEQLPLEHYDSVLVFADQSFEDNMTLSDSRTLACLVLINDIQQKRSASLVMMPVEPVPEEEEEEEEEEHEQEVEEEEEEQKQEKNEAAAPAAAVVAEDEVEEEKAGQKERAETEEKKDQQLQPHPDEQGSHSTEDGDGDDDNDDDDDEDQPDPLDEPHHNHDVLCECDICTKHVGPLHPALSPKKRKEELAEQASGEGGEDGKDDGGQIQDPEDVKLVHVRPQGLTSTRLDATDTSVLRQPWTDAASAKPYSRRELQEFAKAINLSANSQTQDIVVALRECLQDSLPTEQDHHRARMGAEAGAGTGAGGNDKHGSSSSSNNKKKKKTAAPESSPSSVTEFPSVAERRGPSPVSGTSEEDVRNDDIRDEEEEEEEEQKNKAGDAEKTLVAAEARAAFHLMDSDDDGLISSEDAIAACRRIKGERKQAASGGGALLRIRDVLVGATRALFAANANTPRSMTEAEWMATLRPGGHDGSGGSGGALFEEEEASSKGTGDTDSGSEALSEVGRAEAMIRRTSNFTVPAGLQGQKSGAKGRKHVLISEMVRRREE